MGKDLNGKEKESPRSSQSSPVRSPKRNRSPHGNNEPGDTSRPSSPFEGGKNLLPKSFFGLYLSGDTGNPTKLHVAIQEDDIKTVKLILKKNADLVFARDRSGRTALHWAVVLGSPSVTKRILRDTSWWYLDRCDYNGCTPLHYTAQAGRSEETKRLLNRGANANARDLRKRTPLHYAVLVGNVFVIQKLVERKGNLSLEDQDGYLPIDFTENADVIAFVEKLMKPKFSCFRMCFPLPARKPVGKIDHKDKFPYRHEGNKVKRCLPQDMLKGMMAADGKRNKHDLEHKEA